MNATANDSDNQVIEYAVDYATIDPVKKMFQSLGAQTFLPPIPGLSEFPGCRGDSVHIVQFGDMFFGSLIEGLGTRALVADEIYRTTGVSHYQAIARSAAATIFNDFATSGIQPIACFMYLSAGSNEVFADLKKMADLGLGWREACLKEQAMWGGGETPMLQDVLQPGAFELAGSTYGLMTSGRPIGSGDIRPTDKIVFLASSGVHDNGLTLCRDIRTRRLMYPGYGTLMSDGQSFGDALMKPTVLYGPLVRRLLEAKIPIHAALNITGHGLAKLARAVQPFDYVVTELPKPQPVFEFIAQYSGLPPQVMYSKFNMGVGFALIVPCQSANFVIGSARAFGYDAWEGGVVDESDCGKKRVLLPNGIVFTEKDVAVR